MAVVRTLLVWLVVAECWVQHTTGSCPTGKFGDSCFYSCHCADPCDQTTGDCGGGCDAGWVGGHGATCQKENVAYNKHATTPSGLYTHDPPWSADNAVDGNRDQDVFGNSCFLSADGVKAVWTVDLGQQYMIYDVRIYNRAGYITRLQTAVLSLSNSSSSTPGVTCYTFPTHTPQTDNSVYDVTCDGTGRYFTITHNTHTLNLCEVEIFVCSQGTFGELCNHFCHCSDGPCDRFSGICAGDCRAGWQGQNCSTECDKDQYGVSCNETCGNRKCAAQSSCDRRTGSCDTGCLPGWTEVDCKHECSPGTYGQNCSLLCTDRNCAGNSSCDHVTGKCVTRCKTGWMGIDCIQACETHRYGPNCDKACAARQCLGNSSCNSTGHCDSGCETGWTLDDCTACDSQHYGHHCIKTCASRHCEGNSSCNSTGDCDTGCETGWTLHDCTEEAGSVQAAGNNAGQLAVAVVLTFVAGVAVGVIVSVVVWRRRTRRLHKTSHTANVSNAQTERSQAGDDVGTATRTYNSLNAVLYDTKMNGETYSTITSGKTDLETGANVLTCDVSDPIGTGAYETLDNTSRGTDGEYSEIGKPK